LANKDYYSILGISENANKEDIKKAYKKLAKKYHPDTKPEEEKKEAEEKFKEINEAFSVLIDDQKREQYNYSKMHPNMDFNPHTGGFNSNMDFEDIIRQNFGNDFMSDIFSSFFSRTNTSRTQNARILNEDIYVEIVLMPEDTMSDIKKNISYNKNVFCEECNGNGGFDAKSCSTCNGTGTERIIRNSGFFQTISESRCSHCLGKGKTFKNKCEKCKGNGYIQKSENFLLNIEKGTVGRLVLEGKGHAIHKNVAPGNFIVQILYQGSNDFDILNDNGDVQTVLQMNPINAMLGGPFSIKGLDGKENILNIPQLCKVGTRLKVKNQGMYLKSKKKRGDLFILIEYLMPKELTKKQREILLNYIEEEKTEKMQEIAS